MLIVKYHFFFQAEDGIRDGHVTGVQTCALPISRAASSAGSSPSEFTGATTRISTPWLRRSWMSLICLGSSLFALVTTSSARSEERRVGKEWRSRGSPEHVKQK